ncbi:hypothetical protein GCM10023405_11740 [Streptomonospora salina]
MASPTGTVPGSTGLRGLSRPEPGFLAILSPQKLTASCSRVNPPADRFCPITPVGSRLLSPSNH